MTTATLAKGQEPMSEEKWATHTNCDTAGRKHKFRWKWDISGHWTDQAVCVHCGHETILARTNEDGQSVTGT